MIPGPGLPEIHLATLYKKTVIMCDLLLDRIRAGIEENFEISETTVRQ